MGGVASGDQDADTSVVPARACCDECRLALEGLLGDEQRKTGWMRAEAAGDPGPWRQQAILGRRDWDADGLRDIVRDYVIEHLADDDAVLVIDETGFPARRVVRSGATIHWFRREDHELPDRSLRCLCFAPRSRVHRSRAVSSEGMDRRSRSPGSRIRALRCRLCHQTTACDENDYYATACRSHSNGSRAILSTVLAISNSNYVAPAKAMYSGPGQRSCISFLGQAAIRRRQG